MVSKVRYGALVTIILTVYMPLYTGWHINWDLHFSKLNWTRSYAVVPCELNGVPQREQYEAEVNRFLNDPAFRQDVIQDRNKWELESFCNHVAALISGYRDEIVNGPKVERPRLLTENDKDLLRKLRLLFDDGELQSAYNKIKSNERNQSGLQEQLEEVQDNVQTNISAIAETPKKTVLCFLLLGFAYYAFTYHAAELKEMAQEAKEGVQQGAHIAGNAIAHALEKPKPDQKPETNPDEKK